LSTTEGLHVLIIPSADVPGNVGTVPPAQTVRLVPKLNVGVMIGLTTTENNPVDAHWPEVGANK